MRRSATCALGTLQLAALPPLSLYVHLPWCLKKCPYCDFNSHELLAAGTPAAEGAAGLGAALRVVEEAPCAPTH